MVYGAASGLLRRHVLVPRKVAQPLTQPPHPTVSRSPQEFVIKLDVPATVGSEGRRIPRELPPAAEHFVGRQTEVRQLTERLRAGKNTAVVGAAGMGKTAVAAVAVPEG